MDGLSKLTVLAATLAFSLGVGLLLGLPAEPAAAQDSSAASADARSSAAEPLPLTGGSLEAGILACRAAGVTAADTANYRACNGYIAGIIVGLSAFANLTGTPQPFCFGTNAGDATIQDAILGFLATNPAARRDSVPAVLVAALTLRFPCSHSNPDAGDIAPDAQ